MVFRVEKLHQGSTKNNNKPFNVMEVKYAAYNKALVFLCHPDRTVLNHSVTDESEIECFM